MIPYICQTKHDPANGLYGDCVRACIASILEIEPDKVPHFFDYDETENNQIGHDRIAEFLNDRGLCLFTFAFDPIFPLETVLANMERQPGHYILLGGTAYEADHAVIGKGDKIVHNPGIVGVIKPASIGQWQIWVIGVK